MLLWDLNNKSGRLLHLWQRVRCALPDQRYWIFRFFLGA